MEGVGGGSESAFTAFYRSVNGLSLQFASSQRCCVTVPVQYYYSTAWHAQLPTLISATDFTKTGGLLVSEEAFVLKWIAVMD